MKLALPNSLPDFSRRETWLGFFTYSLFVFSTFSITGIEASVVLLYLLVIFHRTRSTSLEKLPLLVIAPFLVWGAVAVASALVNPDPLDNLAALRHQYRIFLPFVLLVSLGQVDLRRLLKVYLYFLCLMSLYGIAQVFWGIDLFRPSGDEPQFHSGLSGYGTTFFRARGNFSGPGAFANHMMMLALLFLSLALAEKRFYRSVWCWGSLIMFAGLVASFGRSAWIGAIVGLMILALSLRRAWSIPIIVGTALLLIWMIVAIKMEWISSQPDRQSNPIINRIVTASTADRDGRIRIGLWKAGLSAIPRRPWLGNGFDNREAKLLPWRVRRELRKVIRIRANTVLDLHNIYLQIAVDLGLIGLAAYLGMWAVIFAWNAIWIRRAQGAFLFESRLLWGCSAALAGEMVDGLFHSTFFKGNSNTGILIIMGLSLYAGLRIRRGLQNQKPAIA